MTITIPIGDAGRKCGECTLCCKLLPVRELHKKGGQRCQHQRMGKGCVIYARRPPSCMVWSCVWYADPEAAGDMRRPDRTHYVVDPMPDFVIVDLDGKRDRLDVIQVWVDPLYPDAHRDPALRDYLGRMGAEHGVAGLIRYNEMDAWVLFPPALTGGHWFERKPQPQDRMRPEGHSMAERFGIG